MDNIKNWDEALENLNLSLEKFSKDTEGLLQLLGTKRTIELLDMLKAGIYGLKGVSPEEKAKVIEKPDSKHIWIEPEDGNPIYLIEFLREDGKNILFKHAFATYIVTEDCSTIIRETDGKELDNLHGDNGYYLHKYIDNIINKGFMLSIDLERF